MKKFYSLLAMLLLVCSNTFAAYTVTKTVSDLYPTHADGQVIVPLYSDDDITITVNKDGDNGKIYGKGGTRDWRVYEKDNPVITVSTSKSCYLSSVKFTFTTTNNAELTYGGKAVTSDVSVTAGAPQKMLFRVVGQGNKGQVRITGFSVTYSDQPVYELYGVFSEDGKRFTLRYNAFKSIAEAAGMNPLSYDEWSSNAYEDARAEVDTIELADDMSKILPERTDFWFYDFQHAVAIVGLDKLNTSEAWKMNDMFSYCESLKKIDLSKFNTARCQDMCDMFKRCEDITALDLSTFNTENVIDFSSMFSYCTKLKRLDLSKFKTSAAENMKEMFANCHSLVSVKMSKFDTKKVTNMAYMFYYCSDLRSVDLLSFDFNNVTNTNSMFESCTKLEEILCKKAINKIDKITYSTNMFKSCLKLVGEKGTAYDADNVDKTYARLDGGESNPGYFSAEPVNLYGLFSDGDMTFTLYYDHFLDRNNGIEEWTDDEFYTKRQGVQTLVLDKSMKNARPTSTAFWFQDFEGIYEIENFDYLNMSEVLYADGMFLGCANLDVLDLNKWDISKLETTNSMFANCTNLHTIYCDNDWFERDYIVTSDNMFSGCENLEGPNGTEYDAENANDASYARPDGGAEAPGYFSGPNEVYGVFDTDYNIFTLYYDRKRISRGGVLNWTDNDYADLREAMTAIKIDDSMNDASIESTAFWFFNFPHVKMIENIEALHTSSVTDMRCMFADCESLKVLDLTGFSTSEVTSMSNMFAGCSTLTVLDLRSFDISNVTDFSYMFYGCTNLILLYNNNDWSAGEVDGEGMFEDCESLLGEKGTTYDAEHTDLAYARPDDGEDAPGYFSIGAPTMLYGAFSDDGKELTIYDDDQKDARKGLHPNEWYGLSKVANVEKVTFDETVANERPNRTDEWFANFSSLETIEGLDNLNTEEVTNMDAMFAGCMALKELDLRAFNTENVESMNSMFAYCSSIKELDLSSFVTPYVMDMSGMFAFCSSLEKITFGSSFDTWGVNHMAGMFYYCIKLKKLDLRTFDISNVEETDLMFKSCPSLTTIYCKADGWSNPEHLTSSDQMFGCENLVGGAGTAFDAGNPDDFTYARIDRGEEEPGYFTGVFTVEFFDYDANVIKTEEVIQGEAATAPADEDVPAPTGYHFTGEWNDEFDKVEDDMGVLALYAINTYTVTFLDKDGATIDEQTIDYNEAAEAPDAPEVEGYHFTGWDEDFEHITSDLTVQAQYEINVYTVIFLDKDGNQIGDAQEIEHGSAATAPTAPTVTGYHFVEWDKEFLEITSDLTVKAVYEKNEYTVKFIDWNGSELSSQIVKYQEAAKAPADPTREGYTFTGWDKDFSSITSDLTVNAQYTINVYTVIFLDKDGKQIGEAQTIEWGKSATAPEAPAVEGYHFTGWDKKFDNVTSDLTVKAQYAINVYTVTFVDKDGKQIGDAQEVEHGKAATAPTAPTVEGYHFTGWDKKFDNVTSDLTVKAQYAINTYTVIFVDYDYKEIKTETVEWGKAATAPSDPTREGYTFKGWDKDFSNVTEDLTVRAQYAINVYTVTFLDKDGNTLKTEKVEYGKSATAPEAPVVAGWTFAGWDKAFNVVKSDLTVQATYTQNPVYTVTFKDWDGTVITSVKVEEGKSAVKPDDPIREGYTFTGWDKKFDNVTSDLTVTAQYTINVYTVTFVDKDGKTIGEAQKVEYGKAATAPEAPTVEGYHFTGWDKKFDNITSDLTVKALYAINTYTVTFVDYDDKELKTETVEHGKAATAPSDPKREGYTFKGWDKDFSNITADLTVKAQYTINVYTVTFLDKDGKTLKTEEVEYGKSATAPEAPTVEGYHFTGWDKAFDKVTSDLTVKAQYAINVYTVTFLDKDGKQIGEAQKVEHGKAATAPEAPTVEGYHFTGWDKDFSSITSDLTVTAQYAINVYTVTFLDKDGKTLKTEKVEHGKAATAPEPPVVEGWTFAGWDKAFNVVKSDLTVRATYTQNPVYTVTFVDYDGSVIASVKVEEGKSAVKPDDPIREGYTFIGWDKSFDNVTSDLTVTALYEEIIVIDYTPQNLSVVVEALGDDDLRITLSWDAVEGAASYDLQLLLGKQVIFAGNTFGMNVISLKLSEILQVATIAPGTYLIDWFVRSTDDKTQAISDWAQGEAFEITIKEPVQGIDEITNDQSPMTNTRKEMRNGLLYIIRNGRTYDVNGKLIQ